MTIKDVATKAGVSISTVSRVVNNQPGVRAEIRERVQRIIDETGYRPNRLAVELLKKETRLVGIILPYVHSYYFDRIEAINQGCREHDYQVMLASSGRDVATELAQFELFYQKQVDGLIFFASHLTPEHDALFARRSSQLKIVVIDQESSVAGIPCVLQDNYDGARTATNHLLELGHRRIAYIGGPSYDPAVQDRLRGFKDVMAAHKLDIPAEFVRIGRYSFQSGYREMQAIFESGLNTPTAVFSATDDMAIGAIRAIREAGLTIPDDISVIGFDDIRVASFFNPPLTTIRQDQGDMGRQAIDMLFEWIGRGRVRMKKVIMDYELIVRASTRSL